MLVAAGAEYEMVAPETGETPSFKVCDNGSFELVFFVGARADPNKPDADGQAPLSVVCCEGHETATKRGHHDVVTFLVDNRALRTAQCQQEGKLEAPA